MNAAVEPDWHLKDWLAHFGKKQASLVNELGWDKSKAHIIWHSKQPYRRDYVNEVSRWLGLEPYELLMAPREALALRQLKASAAAIADELRAAEAGARPRSTAGA